MPGCEDDEPPSSGVVHLKVTAETLLPKKDPETEARIDALTAPGKVPDYVTPGDIRKARQAARREYRQDLKDAVKGELAKRGLKVEDMVKVVFDDAVSTVKRKVMERLAEADVSGALIKTEIQILVRGEFGKNGLPTIKAFLEAEAIAYAKEMINRNVHINVKEGTW
jgi:hypothetical protein